MLRGNGEGGGGSFRGRKIGIYFIKIFRLKNMRQQQGQWRRPTANLLKIPSHTCWHAHWHTHSHTLPNTHTHSSPTRVANDAAHHERGKNLLNYELSPEPRKLTQTHTQCPTASVSLSLSDTLPVYPFSAPSLSLLLSVFVCEIGSNLRRACVDGAKGYGRAWCWQGFSCIWQF